MKNARPSKRSGFSLIELMVAMVAGSFVIVGAYYMSDVSSRVFSEQLRRAESQMTLRSATEQLRRDIGRAGYLSLRDTSELAGCTGGVAPDLGAGTNNVSPVAVTAAAVATNASGQTLVLTGNFSTAEHYFISPLSSATTIVPQPANEGYRRSFENPLLPGTFMPNRFLEAFAADPSNPAMPGRMLSITQLGRRVLLRQIVAVNETAIPPSITLGSPIDIGAAGAAGSCVTPAGAVVAPVSMIEYSIQIPDGALNRVGGQTYMTGGAISAGGAPAALRPVLVRRELDIVTRQPIPNTERVILDSILAQNPGVPASGFVISAVYDANPTSVGAGASPPALTFTSTPQALPDMGRIRSLIIQLTVESSETVQLDTAAQGRQAAGRRFLRFEVMMPNAANNSGVF